VDWVRFLTDKNNLITAGVGIGTFAAIASVALPMLGIGPNLEKRMKSVAERREELKRRSRQAMAKDKGEKEGSGIRQVDEGFYKKVVERLQLKRLLEDPKVVDKLAQAGFRGPRPVTTFYFFRLVMPFVFLVGTAAYLFLLNGFGLQLIQKLCVAFFAFVIGFYAPNLYISNVASKRRGSIIQAFPDALDLLLICVESGMSIEAAIMKVSQEIGGRSIELAEEMQLLTAELSYLPERRMAYEGLAKRTNHPGVKSVATAMIQAEKYGTPLGAALRVMAKENRELRLAAAEKKAAALPAQLTVPMILFFLPVLFVVILGPAIIQIQDMNKPH
jgi:tight adherence protein C